MLSSDITFNRRSSGQAPVSVTFIIREAKTSDLLMNRGEQPITLDVRPDYPTYCPVSKTIEWLRMLRLLDVNFQITKSRTIWPTVYNRGSSKQVETFSPAEATAARMPAGVAP